MGVMAHMYFKGAGFDSGFDDWRIVPGHHVRPEHRPRHHVAAAREARRGDARRPRERLAPLLLLGALPRPARPLPCTTTGSTGARTRATATTARCTFTDQYLGKLLDFIATKSWAKRTTIIVTADHGEEFGEHGMTRHGFEVWNTLVHVPLMIVAPGAAPRHIDVLRSGIDLAPTILELLRRRGRPVVRGQVARGRGLRRRPRRARRGRRPPDDERQRPAARARARHREAHLLRHDSCCQLFDLAHDPMEKSPIVRGDDFDDMKARYDAVEQDHQGGRALRLRRRLPQQRLREEAAARRSSVAMRVVPVACLKDNYAYLVIARGGEAAVVDASEAAPVRDAVRREGVRLVAIWSTHHHYDHVGGNEELARELGARGRRATSPTAGACPAQTREVDTGDTVRVGDVEARCIHIPGHTLGAVALLRRSARHRDALTEPRVVFTGDTLFCAGCGRLFEGTPAQMHASLETPRGAARRHARLLRARVHREQPALRGARRAGQRGRRARPGARRGAAIARGSPRSGRRSTTSAGATRSCAPALPAIRATLGIPKDADDVTAFAAIRAAKDAFR